MSLLEIDLHPSLRTLRQFGLVALVAFAGLGALVIWKGGLFHLSFGAAARPIAYCLWGIGAFSGLMSLVAPGVNRWLYVGMIAVSYPIGFVLSYVFLAMIFYGVITPIGLVFRLVGRDPLHRRFDRRAESYWTTHHEPESVDRYFLQF